MLNVNTVLSCNSKFKNKKSKFNLVIQSIKGIQSKNENTVHLVGAEQVLQLSIIWLCSLCTSGFAQNIFR